MTIGIRTPIEAFERDLRREVGDACIATAPDLLERYTADTYWRALEAAAAGIPLGRPEIVLRPTDEEQVAIAVALANRHEVSVTPWGGGSGTQGGSLPVRGGLVIDTTGLARIVEIDERSLTVTAEAGVNGARLEQALNARGLMLPHYAASAEWATVGGYVAARGSGVLSTRYGKIEDLVVSLRVVTPTGELIETPPVPRHSVGPELTQLFVGSEGTLGIITRVTLMLAPLPAQRRFEAVSFPTVAAGIEAVRRALAVGYRPSVVRMYDEQATQRTLAPVVGAELTGVCAVLCFEGEPASVAAEAEGMLALARAHGGHVLEPALAERWWERRYDFYAAPHQPELPAIWGTIDVVATYSRIEAVYAAVKDALEGPYADAGLQLRVHFSHWYRWGAMLYARFVVPDGAADATALHDRIWEDGVLAVLEAGGVINDHHGVGLKLAPYMPRQHGAAFETLRRLKSCLDPNDVMNPGKLGF